MWGAIIGDLAGSTYEYEQAKKVSKIEPKELITKESFFSDDTILTIAILDAILEQGDYKDYLKKYAKEYENYHPNHKPYFKGVFSPGFTKWAQSAEEGKSTGNGAMMRISPVGYLYNTEEEVIKQAAFATIPSHNTQEAITSATIVARIIFEARKGFSKEEILKKIGREMQYRDFQKFNSTCRETIDNCLYALFTTNSFEEAILTVLSYGGDTDTNACIVGSMAEAFYGVEENLKKQAEEKIPKEFVKKIERGYAKIIH